MTRPESSWQTTMPSGQRKARGSGRRQAAKSQVSEPNASQPTGSPSNPTGSKAPVPLQQWHAGTKAAPSAVQLPASKEQSPASKWQYGWAELPASEMDSRMEQLMEMGFSMSATRSALEACDWDVNKALDSLFTHNVPASKSLMGSDQNTSTSQTLGVSCSSLATDSTTASSTSSPRVGFLLTPQHEASVSPFLLPDLAETAGALAWPPGLDTVAEATPPSASLHLQFPSFAGVQSFAPEHHAAVQSITSTHPSAPVSESPVSVVPRRTLAKVLHTWECNAQSVDTQMSIEMDTFIYVWTDSNTPAGWVYAESLICSSNAGWVPQSMLQQLPPNKCWMRVAKPCRPIYPTQLSVEAGNMLLVDVSQTPEGDGWIYAEQLSTATGLHTEFPRTAGWVPIQCIKWAEV